MALDYFRSIPSRLQQRGLQGLASDQGEIDAEEERKRQEEERAKQLEQIRKQYDDATAQTTQSSQQDTFRDDLLSQAKSRFDELTGHLGQGLSDAGTAVRGAADTAGGAVSDAAGDVGNAIGQYGQQQEDLGRSLQRDASLPYQALGQALAARHEQGRNAVGPLLEAGLDRVAQAAPSQDEVLADLDTQAAASAARKRREQENLRAQGPLGGTLANVTQGLTKTGQTPEEDAERAFIAQRGGYGARAGRTFGSAVAGALGAEKPGEDVAQGAFQPKQQVKEVDAQGRWTGHMIEAPETAGGVRKVARDVGEQVQTALGQGTRNENLLERGQAAVGAGMNLLYGIPAEAAKGAVGRTSADPVSAEIAAAGASILGPGGVGFRALPEVAGALRTGLAAAERPGVRAALAAAARGARTEAGAAKTASAAGITAGALAGPVVGTKAYQDAKAKGATDQEALARAIEAGAQPIQLGELAGLGTGVGLGGLKALKAAPNLPRGVLSRTGNLTPDMGLGEGLRGAVQTGLAQRGADLRGLGEDLGRALDERLPGRRPEMAFGVTPETPTPDVDPAALQAEMKAVNQRKGQAAQALGKARVKLGPIDREPTGLTPETRGLWEAYVDASRRGKEINDTLARSRQTTAAAAPDPLLSDLPASETAPETLPKGGRGSFTPDPAATINPPSFPTARAKGLVAGQPEQYQVTPGAPNSVTPTRMAGQQGETPAFYSALQRAVDSLPPGRLSPAQVAKQLLAMADVKRDQLHWSGVADYLTEKLAANEGRGEAVTKAELSRWLQDHDVRVYEVQKGNASNPAESQRLTQEAERLQAASVEAGERQYQLEQRHENEAWQILQGIHGRLEETPEGRLLLDPSGQGYPLDVEGTAGQVLWGYPNVPKDESLFAHLEEESVGRDPDDPYLKELTAEERQHGLRYADPLLAEATPQERARLEQLRQEYQAGTDEATALEQQASQAESAASNARGQTLPGGPARWLDYAGGGLYLPGAQDPRANVREFLLTLGPRSDMPDQAYTAHWDEPNIIAHIRMSDRVTPDGKRVLLIEELQSDWHQAARKKVLDDAAQPVLDAQGKPQRVGYYPGRRPIEEIRTAPEYQEYQRLEQARQDADTAYHTFSDEGTQQSTNEAYREEQTRGLERARQKLIEAGVPEEALGRMKGAWMERPRDDNGRRLPEPIVLVRYAFPGDTPPDKMSLFGLTTRDAAEPTRVDVLDHGPGYLHSTETEAVQRSAALASEARRLNDEEDGLRRQVGNRLTPEDTVYHYATRGADAVLYEMSEVDPEVAPLKATFRDADLRLQALERERSGAAETAQRHLRQHPDLRQVEHDDQVRHLERRVAELRDDPDVRFQQEQNEAFDRLTVASAKAGQRRNTERRGAYDPFADRDAIAADPEVAAALARVQELTNRDPAPPHTDAKNPTPEYLAWSDRTEDRQNKLRELGALEREARSRRRALENPDHQTGGRPPAGPFSGEGWQRLALKRMLHLAAQEDYDYLGIVPGDVQGQRYNPFRGQGIETIEYDRTSHLLRIERRGHDTAEQQVAPNELGNYVGPGVAEALLKEPAIPGGMGRVTAEDWNGSLVMEDPMGAGMRQSYDKRLPELLTEAARRFGAEVRVAPETDPERALQAGQYDAGVLLDPDKYPEDHVQEGSEEGTTRTRPNLQPAHLLQITPQMREAQAQPGGMSPLFLQQTEGVGTDGSIGRDGTVGDGTMGRVARLADDAGTAAGGVIGAARGYQEADEDDQARRARGEAGVSPFLKAAQALFGGVKGAAIGKVGVRGARVARLLTDPGRARGRALADLTEALPLKGILPGAGGERGPGAILHKDYAGEWLALDQSPARVLENKAATLEREAEDTRRGQQAFQRRVDRGGASDVDVEEARERTDLLKKADAAAKAARAQATSARTNEDESVKRLTEAGGALPKNALFEGLEGAREVDPKTGKERVRKTGPVTPEQLNQALLEYRVQGYSFDVAAERAGIKKADLIRVVDDLGIRRTNQQGGAILAERNIPVDAAGKAKPKVTLESLEAEDRAHDAMGDVWWREPLTKEEQAGLTPKQIAQLLKERGLSPTGRRPKPKDPHQYIDLDGNVQSADSTYEAVFFRMLDELKQQGTVAYWQKGLVGDEAFAFNEAMLDKWRGLPFQTKEGINAAFAPDFFVITRDPQTGEFHMEVIEVKNTGIYARPEWRVPEKLAQGREFLEQNGIGFRIFTGDQIGRSYLASLQDSDLAPNAQGRMGMPDPEQRANLLKALGEDFGKTQTAARVRLGEWKPQTVPEPGAPPSSMDIPESRYDPRDAPGEEPLFPGEPAGLGRTFSERVGEQPGQTVHELLADYNRRSAGQKLVPDASEAISRMRPKAEDAIARFRAKPMEAWGSKGMTYNLRTQTEVPMAPGAGYTVSPFGHAEMVFKGEDVHPVAFAAWLSEHRDLLEDPAVRVGFWYDREAKKTTIDLVVETPDLADAEALGKAADQKAIFHLGDQTGDPEKFLDYGEAGRLDARRTRGEELDAFARWRDARSSEPRSDGASGAVADLEAVAGGRPGATRPPGLDVPGGPDRSGGLADGAGAVGGPGGAGRVPGDRPVLPTGPRSPAPYRGSGEGTGAPTAPNYPLARSGARSGITAEPLSREDAEAEGLAHFRATGELLPGWEMGPSGPHPPLFPSEADYDAHLEGVIAQNRADFRALPLGDKARQVGRDVTDVYQDLRRGLAPGLPGDRLDVAASATGAALGGLSEAGQPAPDDESPEARLRRIAGATATGGVAGLTARRQGARIGRALPRVLGNLPDLRASPVDRLIGDETGSLGIASGAASTAPGATAGAAGSRAGSGSPSAPVAPGSTSGAQGYADVKERMRAALERGASEAELAAIEADAATADPGERSGWETAAAGYKLGMLMTVRGIMRQVAGGLTVGAWQPGERFLAGALAEAFGGSGTVEQPRMAEAGKMLGATFNWHNLTQAASEAVASAAGKTTGAAGAGAEAIEATGGKSGGTGLKGAANRFFDRGYQVFSVADTFFNRLASNAEMQATAYRLARGGEGQGADLNARMADLLANDERVQEAGAAAAKYRTLQQDLDRYGKAIDGARKLPGGWLVMPFWKTPYNSAKYDLERSPIGLGKTIYQAARGGNEAISETEKYERFARGLMGSVLALGLVRAAGDGNLTGPEPQDPAERDAWQAEGRTPYSLRVGGRWVPINQVPGLNATLTQVMSLHDYVDRRVRAGTWKPADVKTYDGLATALAVGTADNLLRRPFFDTLQAMLEAVEKGTGQAADEEAGPSVLEGAGNVGRSFIPGIVKEAERATGTVNRAPRNLAEQVKAGIPGLSGQVPERRDRFGRPVVRTGSGSGDPLREIVGGAERLLNPMQGQQERPSPRRYVGTKSIEEDAAVAAIARRLDAYQKDPLHAPRPSEADLALLGRHGTESSGLYTTTRQLARDRAKQVGRGETPFPAYDEALARLRTVSGGGGGRGGGGLAKVSPVARLLLAR